MKVLIIEPKQMPIVREIEGGLDSLQSIVGGYIEAIYPFEDEVGIICNEEGKLIGLPLNRALYHEGEIYEIIAGTFIIAGLSEDNFCSLSDDLIKKYMDLFFLPQGFAKVDGKIVAFPLLNAIFE